MLKIYQVESDKDHGTTPQRFRTIKEHPRALYSNHSAIYCRGQSLSSYVIYKYTIVNYSGIMVDKLGG